MALGRAAMDGRQGRSCSPVGSLLFTSEERVFALHDEAMVRRDGKQLKDFAMVFSVGEPQTVQ